MSIEDTIIAIVSEETPLLNAQLAELSGLSSEELAIFKDYRDEIGPGRMQQIIARLVEMAEADITLDFSSVFKYLLADEDESVRSKAIEGLWENEQPSLIEPLIEMMKNDCSDTVRAAAAIALGKFAMLAEHGKLREPYASRVQDALLEVIENEETPVEVGRRALEAAAPLSLPRVQDTIREAYWSTAPRYKISSIYAMGKSCDSSWLPLLLEELSSLDAEARYEAAGACGELEEEEAVPYLQELLDDDDIDVRMAAVQALGKIGGEQAKETLEECLESENEALRQAVEQALGELEAGEDPLHFHFHNDDTE